MCRDADNPDVISEFFVDMSKPGISLSPLTKLGLRMDSCCEVYMDNVELEEKDIFGKEGNGFARGINDFNFERWLVGACDYGTAIAIYEDACRHANQRIAFGKPITKLQMIQEKLCDMEIKVQNTRNMLYKTLWKLDNGESVQLDSAMLKRYGCSECFQVADMALSIYAGLGYTTEVRIGRIWADLRGNMFGGGTHEVMATLPAARLPRSTPISKSRIRQSVKKRIREGKGTR